MKLERLWQRLDFSKPIKGKDLDLETYDKKFAMAEYILENNLIDKDDIRVWKLLSDVTIYANLFFKDDEGNPFKLTAYQDAIANCQHDFTAMGPNRFILYKAANQTGKSALLALLALHHVLNEDNIKVVMISKSLPQSQDLLRQVKFLLNNSIFADSWTEDLGDTANTTILSFKREVKDSKGKLLRTYVSSIICTPAGEGTLGYPVNYMYLDEADFYEYAKKFFWRIAKPRTLKTKGQVILFSNPDPEISRASSLMWELWHGDLFGRKFSFYFLDAPWNSREEYDRDRRNTPAYIFASTHDGDFPDEGGAFFSHREIQDMMNRDWLNALPVVDGPVYIGLDLGKMHDQTILMVGVSKKPLNALDKYKDLDVRYIEPFKLKTDYDVIANRLVELKEHYKRTGVIIGYDATGQKTFGDFLKRMGISAIPVDFAKKETNKTQLYNDFKLMVENRKIKFVYDRHLETQLSELQFKLTETKKLKVEARTENVHDDYPDAAAILINIAVSPSRVPVTAQYVKIPEKKEGVDSEREGYEDYMRKTIDSARKGTVPFSNGGMRGW